MKRQICIQIVETPSRVIISAIDSDNGNNVTLVDEYIENMDYYVADVLLQRSISFFEGLGFEVFVFDNTMVYQKQSSGFEEEDIMEVHLE